MTVYRADAGGSDADDIPLTIEEYERAPELAVEVASPSDRWSELEEKARAYRRPGPRRSGARRLSRFRSIFGLFE